MIRFGGFGLNLPTLGVLIVTLVVLFVGWAIISPSLNLPMPYEVAP